jgi:glycogen synthase
MKGGLDYADCMDTVSPCYRREIQTPEVGGDWTD